MRPTLTEQQTAFFTKNGYIEIAGIPFDSAALFATFPFTEFPSTELPTKGRDLWRTHPILRTLLLRKLAPLALDLTGKKQLRLACDQAIPASFSLKTRLPAKDLFSIQGLALCALIANHPASRAPSQLGLLPLPSQPENILFFKPTLLLDWPEFAKSPTDLYLAAYALNNAVYVQNPKDPATNALKSLGYGFGDVLTNEFHPLIVHNNFF